MNACKEGSGSPQFRGMHRVGSFNKNSWKNPAGITSKELKPAHECMQRGKWARGGGTLGISGWGCTAGTLEPWNP